MPNRWQVIVEVTLDIEDDDSEWSAVKRTKAALEKIRGKEIAHYHILQQPKVVVEFD